MTDKLIADLAAKLGTTADHVWAILVSGMFAEGLTAAMFAVISISLTVWALTTRKHEDEDNERYIWMFIVRVVVCIIFGSASLINLYEAIMYLCVPEYMALSTILQLLKH